MKLENVTAEVRPRGRWESIDFGCALVRESYGMIVKTLLMTIVPLWLVLWLVLGEISFALVFLAYWLTLPFVGRVVLYVLSRKLFGEEVRVWEVLKQWPKMLVRRFFHAILFGRFSPSRSLALPVSELENLKGKDYSARVSLLDRNGGDGAAQTAMIGWLLICIAGVGLLILLNLLMPFSIEIISFEDDAFWGDETGALIGKWTVALYAFGALLIEPFCVGAGFAMYVNSRTITEGWDIELAFKRMSSRLERRQSPVLQLPKQKSTLSDTKSLLVPFLLLAASFLMTSSPMASAENTETTERLEKSSQQLESLALSVDGTKQPMTESQKLAREVYSGEEFQVHAEMVKERAPRETSSSWSWGGFDDFGGMAILKAIFGVAVYVAIGAFVLFVVFLLVKNNYLFQRRTKQSSQNLKKKRVESVMGMNVTSESLPDDIVKAALEAWSQGEAKLALSLLYRGAISWCADHTSVEFANSDTEQDCMRKLESLEEFHQQNYFNELTMLWMSLAYGRQIPEDVSLRQLCSTWPFSNKDKREEGGTSL